MSICTDIIRTATVAPRRVRKAECSEFEGQQRWVNLVGSFNLTPDPGDNDVRSGGVAWAIWDLPVSVAWQDVDDRGNDLLFVAMGDRVCILDWNRYRDEVNWETYLAIYRRLTLGPIPASRQAEEDGRYRLSYLKRFREIHFELVTAPTDEGTQYRVSVQEDGADAATAATGVRQTQRQGKAHVAKKGYSFLCTLEHEANEDFPLAWWEAEWEELGGRREHNPIVAT